MIAVEHKKELLKADKDYDIFILLLYCFGVYIIEVIIASCWRQNFGTHNNIKEM